MKCTLWVQVFYPEFPSFSRPHRPVCHEWTAVQSETDAMINYAGKRPLFSQCDGRPSATCSSCFWSSLVSWGEMLLPIRLPDGKHHGTKHEYKSCHTDEWFLSAVKQLPDTLSCPSTASCLFIATLVPFIKLWAKQMVWFHQELFKAKPKKGGVLSEPPPREHLEHLITPRTGVEGWRNISFF